MKHYWLYALKLQDGKYYVGVTSKTVEERFQQHKNEYFAAEWTKIYKPISIDQSVDLGITTYARAEEFENKVTRRYIKEYGLDNVRGGNITYRGKMVSRGGYIWRFEDWKDFYMVLLCLAMYIILAGYIIWDYFARHFHQ